VTLRSVSTPVGQRLVQDFPLDWPDIARLGMGGVTDARRLAFTLWSPRRARCELVTESC
jgi:hypothetical protein